MPYHSNFERCHMVEALQAQARFCDELACACLDQTHAEDFRRKADKYRAAAVLIRPTNRSRQSADGQIGVSSLTQ